MLRLSASVFECKKTGAGFCRARNYVWEIPIRFSDGGTRLIELSNETADRAK
jgi:hypothetical protein